jgi:hypothetical protein
MEEETIIIQKHQFKFVKCSENHFRTRFSIESSSLNLENILNFDLMKLIYDLNPDIFQECSINKISDSEAIYIIIFKHLFKDIGLPQRYAHVKLTRKQEGNKITFIGSPIFSKPSITIPEGCQQLPTQSLIYECNMESLHKINIIQNVYFQKHFNPPDFLIKFLGNFSIKIFLRLKQFIEKM